MTNVTITRLKFERVFGTVMSTSSYGFPRSETRSPGREPCSRRPAAPSLRSKRPRTRSILPAWTGTTRPPWSNWRREASGSARRSRRARRVGSRRPGCGGKAGIAAPRTSSPRPRATTVGAASRARSRRLAALEELPATAEAFSAGELSETQAAEIAGAAGADPAAEAELLATAAEQSVKGLRDKARQVRAGVEADDQAWARRLQNSRSAHQWTDPDGAWRADIRLGPDAGARVSSAWDAHTDRIFREAAPPAGASPAAPTPPTASSPP